MVAVKPESARVDPAGATDGSNAVGRPPVIVPGQLSATPAQIGSAPDQTHIRVQQWFNIGATIIAPTTAITALLFYFGYVAVRAQYAYFGVDIDLLALSTSDFLLRSPAALFLPVGAALLLALSATWTRSSYVKLLGSSARRNKLRVAAWSLVVLGALLFVRGLAGVAVPQISRTETIAATPTALALGLTGVAIGRSIFRRLDDNGAVELAARRSERLGTALLVGFVLLMMFWSSSSVAAAYGRGRGVSLAGRLTSQPAVVLDTKERLWIAFDGVAESALPADDEQEYHYRYRGFRLLVQSGDRMFLVPELWPGVNTPAATVLVRLNDDVRVQFLP